MGPANAIYGTHAFVTGLCNSGYEFVTGADMFAEMNYRRGSAVGAMLLLL